MKRLILALCGALFLALGPLPVVSAHGWPWHHHAKSDATTKSTNSKGGANPGPAGVGATQKTKKAKARHEKRQHNKSTPLYSIPKSVGWFHHGPGPAGAGSHQK
jgi:hypothetical protein